MAKLVHCRACGREINKKAKFCQYCGETIENRLLWTFVLSLIIVAAFVSVIDLVIEGLDLLGKSVEPIASSPPK